MTDDQPNPPEERKPDEPEHGFVEELRHDVEEIAHEIEHVVEEAVERVPEPVRWTVGKIVRLVVLIVVALVVLFAVSTVLYLANHTQLMARWVTLSINSSLLRDTDLTLEMADVRGNLFREVQVIEPRLRYRGDNGPPVLQAPAIAIRASLFSLIRRDGKIEVQIQQPVFRLTRRPDGTLRLPELRPGQRPPKKTSGGTPVSVIRLVTHDGSAHVEGFDPVRGLDLDARVYLSPGKRIVLDRLRWKEGPLATRDFDLAGEVAIADSVVFRIARLKTRDVSLSARAAWRNGSTERQVSANLERVRWGWIAEATKNRSFDVPGEGGARIEAVVDTSWRGRLATKLSWNGLEASGTGLFRYRDGLVTVDDLEAVSGPTRLDGSFGWSTAGWRIGGDATDVDPQKLAAIGVPGWPEGLAEGWFQYIVDTRRKPASSRLELELKNTMLAGFHADSGLATVTTTAPGVGSFSVRARRAEGQMNLDATLVPGGWTGTWRLQNLRLEEWPDGRASGMRGLLDLGEGTIVSDPNGLHVEGSLAGHHATWLGLDAETWRLEGVRGRLLPKPDLEATAHIGGSTYLGVHFDSAAVLFGLGDGTTELRSIKAHAGDTLVRVTGLAHFSEGSWTLELDQASAISRQFTWTAEPPTRLSGNSSGTTFERLVARDGNSSLAISGRWASPTGSYDWQFRGDRLDLTRLGLPAEWGTGGVADVVLDVHGVPGDPRWTLKAEVGRPVLQKFTADSLRIELGGRPSHLDAVATLETGGGRLNGNLRFEDMAKPWPDTLVAHRIIGWLEDAARWSGEIRAEGVPIQSFHTVAPAARDWRGAVNGTLTIGGRPARPELELKAGTSMLAWREVTGDRVEVSASYREGVLTVPRAQLDREGLTSSASGRMPLGLAFGRTPEVSGEPMHWTVDVPNGDLGILPRVMPQIGFAAGRFEGHAEIGGSAKRPSVEGRFAVHEGRFRMAGREEVFDHVQAVARLDERRVVLDTLTARQGQEGRLTASGEAELGPAGLEKYRFDVIAKNVKAIESAAYAAEFDGRFTVTQGPVIHGQRVPFVTGRAEVHRAVILLNFANMTETQQVATAAAPLYWTYRVDVYATDNIHWQPPEGDIEFSADLSAEQTPNDLILYGEVKALRGHYYFLDNRFTVRKADLNFDNVSGVNPVLDAEAVTRIQPSGADADLGGTSTSDEPHEITVFLRGRAREPEIAFESDPDDWAEDRILRELTVGRFYAGRLNLGDPVDNYLTRAINRTLSDEMSRAFRGYVNEWTLERERGGLFAGEGDVLMGVGTQVTSNLQVRYRQRVPGFERPTNTTSERSVDPLERDIGAEYRLNRFFYVTSEVLQRRRLSPTGTTSTTGPEYNLNLKARWEY